MAKLSWYELGDSAPSQPQVTLLKLLALPAQQVPGPHPSHRPPQRLKSPSTLPGLLLEAQSYNPAVNGMAFGGQDSITFIYSQISLEPLNHEDEAINSTPYPHGASIQVGGGRRQRKEGVRWCLIAALQETEG